MKHNNSIPAGCLKALCLLILIFTGAVVITLNFRWIYYMDISLLNLEKISGMDASSIRSCYDTLIRYNLVWNRGELIFPGLPMSGTAAIHFREVKRIFDGIQIAFLISGILSLFFLITSRNGKRWWMRITGTAGMVLPFILGGLIFLGWDRFFTVFHQLVFHNDYWLFDPAQDPVILLLPDTFFLQCAAIILLLIFAGSILCILGSRRTDIPLQETAWNRYND